MVKYNKQKVHQHICLSSLVEAEQWVSGKFGFLSIFSKKCYEQLTELNDVLDFHLVSIEVD